MALLGVVASMVLDLTVKMSEALWSAKIVNSILDNSMEGLTSTAMQEVFMPTAGRPGPQAKPAGSWPPLRSSQAQLPSGSSLQVQQNMHGGAARYTAPASPSATSEIVKDPTVQPNRLS